MAEKERTENLVWNDLIIDIEGVGKIVYTFTAKNATSLLGAWKEQELLMDYLLENYPNAVFPPSIIKGTATPGKAVSKEISPERKSGVFEIVKVSVEMREDGRPQVKFYQAGHQWPDNTAVMKPEQFAKMFEPLGAEWTEEDFTKNGVFEGISFKLHWTESEKVNTKGNRYKNVTKLEL